MSSVFIDTGVRRLIETEAVSHRLRETGGGLFGWEDHKGVFVACASGPGADAKHGPRSFTPTKAAVASFMELVAQASDRRYGYLGTWHTHPFGSPTPSSVDALTAAGMANQTSLGLPSPLMLIVSTTGTKLRVMLKELRGWRWSPAARRLEPVSVTELNFPERYCPAAELLFAR